jgi:hypothetical protein
MQFLTLIFVIVFVALGFVLFDEDDWRGGPPNFPM